jgi:hypothetical protein
MAEKLPPLPVGVPATSSLFADWYEKMRFFINQFEGQTNSAGRFMGGIDTTDYIIVDDATKGVVLKSPNGHYWVATISNAGVVTWTDLGTTKP